MNRVAELEDYIETYRNERISKKKEYISKNILKLEQTFQAEIKQIVEKQLERQEQEEETKIGFIFYVDY